MRILVIDDDPGVRVLCKIAFRTGGDEILEAASGREGLELLATEHVDAVVLDVMLPSVNGFEILRRIRQDDRMSHLPVVLLSVRVGIQDQIDGWRAGADDYLTKPFSPPRWRRRSTRSAASILSTASSSARDGSTNGSRSGAPDRGTVHARVAIAAAACRPDTIAPSMYPAPSMAISDPANASRPWGRPSSDAISAAQPGGHDNHVPFENLSEIQSWPSTARTWVSGANTRRAASISRGSCASWSSPTPSKPVTSAPPGTSRVPTAAWRGMSPRHADGRGPEPFGHGEHLRGTSRVALCRRTRERRIESR